MDHPYSTLKTLYLLVKDQPQPVNYPCPADRLMVTRRLAWDVLGRHLEVLSVEGLVECRGQENLIVWLTDKGLEKVQSLEALNYL